MIEKIRFLIINDIHETWNALASLKKLIQEREFESTPNIKNVICVLGDFSTIQLDQYQDQSILSSALKNTKKIVENLVELEPFDTICCLPGNHDHPFFYNKAGSEIFHDINNPKQKKIFNLEAEGLFTVDEESDSKLSLFGIGGALPAFLIPKYSELNNPKIFQKVDPKIKRTMRVWDGIPYNNDNCDETEFTEVLDNKLRKAFEIKEGNVQKSDKMHQILFCSHMGPWSSTTAMVKDKVEDVNPNPHLDRILTGSISMDNLFFESAFNVEKYFNSKKNPSDKIGKFEKLSPIASLHGHTHDGSPAVEKRLFEVFNFGPMQEGRFGILNLEKKTKKVGEKEVKMWEIGNVEFGKMNLQK